MLQITPHHNIIFSISPVDFRKGIDGLCAICRSHLETEPIEGAVFVFTNKRHISLKILVYDGIVNVNENCTTSANENCTTCK